MSRNEGSLADYLHDLLGVMEEISRDLHSIRDSVDSIDGRVGRMEELSK